MQYELECGHCGCQFVLDGSPLQRTTRCAVCGGVLTIAVPVAPDPPPEPPPVVPAPVPEPPAKRLDFDAMPPVDRARYLDEPWRGTYLALDSARIAVGFVLPGCVLFLGFELFFSPELKGPPLGPPSVCFFGILFAIPAAVHVVAQFYCALLPRICGAPVAAASLVCYSLAAGVGAADHGLLSALACPALVLLGLDFWVVFLAQFAHRLGRARLVATAERYSARYRVWTVMAFAGYAVALLGAHIGNRAVVGVGECVAGGIGMFLMHGYVALLRRVALTVARRAPIAPAS